MTVLGKKMWAVLFGINILGVVQVLLFGVAFVGPLISGLLGTVLIAYLEMRLKSQQKVEKK